MVSSMDIQMEGMGKWGETKQIPHKTSPVSIGMPARNLVVCGVTFAAKSFWQIGLFKNGMHNAS